MKKLLIPQYFTILDLTKGYHQILVKKKVRKNGVHKDAVWVTDFFGIYFSEYIYMTLKELLDLKSVILL